MKALDQVTSNDMNEQYPGFRWLVLLFGVCGFIHIQMTYLAVAPIIPEIARSLHVDLGTATIILMSSFLAAGTVIWVSIAGPICDRYGSLVVLILGLICLTVPASLLPWIGSKTGVLWVRIVEGFSCGLMYPAISPIVKTLFPPGQRGLANGLLNSSVSVGNSVGVFVGPLLFAALGGAWKSMSAAISVFGWVTLVFGVVLYFAYNSKLPRHEDESADGSTFRKALFSPFTFVGIATMFMTLWASLCLYSLTASYLAADRPLGAGYGSVMAGRLILGATLLGGVLGPILSGFLLDKVFHGKVKWVFYIGFSLLCVGTYLLKSPMVTGNVVLLVAVLTLAGFGSMFAYPTIYYLIACSYPSGVVGRMSALWGGIANCGGVLGLYIAGLTIKAQGSYNTTLTLQSLMALIAFLLTIPLLRLTKRMKEDVGSEAELGVQVAE